LTFDAKLAREVASLARLRLSDREAETFAAQLATVVEHADSLPPAEGGGEREAPPMRLRPDEAFGWDGPDPLGPAPELDGRLVRVPAILERSESS
jgi:Asp-tRNA(Asn)/Glu-tRNA(Gln) amidotransferase C subunit